MYEEIEYYPFDNPPEGGHGIDNEVIGHFTQVSRILCYYHENHIACCPKKSKEFFVALFKITNEI